MQKLLNNTDTLESILQKVNSLPPAGTVGIDTTNATATPNTILQGETAYVNGVQVTGTIPVRNSISVTVNGPNTTLLSGYYSENVTTSVPTVSLASPSLSLNNSTGTVTASVTQNAGYVNAGTKSATLSLSTQAGKTVYPSNQSQTAVAANRYTTGAVTVSGDANLTASNIKSGVTIFNVTGSYAGSSPTYVTQATPTLSLNTTTGVITASSNQVAGYVNAGVKNNTFSLSTQAGIVATPSNTAQTIVAANKYTLGAIKVAGDVNLTAANIKSGVKIFNVTGNYTGSSSGSGSGQYSPGDVVKSYPMSNVTVANFYSYSMGGTGTVGSYNIQYGTAVTHAGNGVVQVSGTTGYLNVTNTTTSASIQSTLRGKYFSKVQTGTSMNSWYEGFFGGGGGGVYYMPTNAVVSNSSQTYMVTHTADVLQTMFAIGS